MFTLTSKHLYVCMFMCADMCSCTRAARMREASLHMHLYWIWGASIHQPRGQILDNIDHHIEQIIIKQLIIDLIQITEWSHTPFSGCFPPFTINQPFITFPPFFFFTREKLHRFSLSRLNSHGCNYKKVWSLLLSSVTFSSLKLSLSFSCCLC